MRASGGGLLLPRLIPVGDPELDERIGGALEPLDGEPVAAGDRPARAAADAGVDRPRRWESAAEACGWPPTSRATLDALLIEEIDPRAPARGGRRDAPILRGTGRYRSRSSQLIYDHWPGNSGRARRDRPRRAPQPAAPSRSPSGGATSRRRASPSPPGSPPPRRRSRRWSAGSRACPTAWWSCPACGWPTSCPTRNGTRSGRTRTAAAKRPIRNFT